MERVWGDLGADRWDLAAESSSSEDDDYQEGTPQASRAPFLETDTRFTSLTLLQRRQSTATGPSKSLACSKSRSGSTRPTGRPTGSP